MDTDALVINQLDDGQKLIDHLLASGFEVTAACWLKTSNDGKWFLYIASPIVDAEGITMAYRRLNPLVRAMPEPFWIDPFEIKLIGSSHPIARDVLNIHVRAPGPRVCPIRWGGIQLGDVSIEGVYLYPIPVSTP